MKTYPTSAESARWWDFPATLLMLAALFTAATRLTATHWTEHLYLVQTLTLVGAIAGLALGQSRFSPAVARGFALVYGLFAIPWQLGLTLGENLQWPDRLSIMNDRLLITIDRLLQQKPVTDNLLFLALMSALFWALSVFAGYTLTRRARPWQVILPPGLVMVVIHAYDSFVPVRTWFLAGYIFLSLLILARLHFLNLHSRLRNSGTYLPPFVGLDSIRLGLLTTAALVLLAWTAPALASSLSPAEQAWRRASSPWMAVRARLSNAFSSLQASVGVVTDFYGDTLPLGRGNPLSDSVILTVESPPRLAAGVRYYWRSRVYDYYDGGWSSTLPATRNITPENFDLNLPFDSGRWISTFTFNTYYPIQLLFTPSQPLWVNRPAQAKLAENPDGTVDLGLLKANPFLGAGDSYQVTASLSAASIMQLRAASGEYPAWVSERYLQLPEEITPRTRQLAAQITTGLDNPYDKVEAITNFLRNTITYSDSIPNPPSSREPVDWFLFDYRQGFCNYYATAEVILLRSIGIPARLAVGYTQGERTAMKEPGIVPTPGRGNLSLPEEEASQGDLYTVRQRDAHAWPEVYFTGLGWVEFEPTVSQLPILRPLDNIPSDEQGDPELSAASIESQAERDRRRWEELLAREAASQPSSLTAGLGISTGLGLALGLAILAGGVVLARRIRRQRGSPPVPVQLEAGLRRLGLQPPSLLRRWARLASLSPLARSYLELNRALARLGRRPAATDTPAERAAALVDLLPEAAIPIQTLLLEYQAAIYSQSPGDAEVARLAGNQIRRLSFLALFQRLLARLQEPARGRRPTFQP